MNIKLKLKDAYESNNLILYKNIMNEFLQKGYGIDYETIYNLINLLINHQKYEEAYPIIKLLEKNINDYDIANKLCFFYHCCFKPKDAERIYKDNNLPDEFLLIRIYLFEGKIEQAKNALEQIKNNLTPDKCEKYLRYKVKIDNHIKFGAFIETEYECFIENGNILQEGHIIYLKHYPTTNLNVFEDDKKVKRPYMIWKIEGQDIYMFPVTTKCNRRDYVLYTQNYPNSHQDRKIKSNMCHTTIDNVLSVKDKVLETDYKNILNYLFTSTYFGLEGEEQKQNLKFMQDYIGVPNQYDIIEYVDKITRNHSYYLVLDIDEKYYKVIKINKDNNTIIDSNIIPIPKKRLIYSITKPKNETLKELLLQISNIQEIEKLSWRRIKVGNTNYIVISEENQICKCLNTASTSSYINISTIKKEKIDFIGDIISEEEQEYIKKIINESSHKIKSKIK